MADGHPSINAMINNLRLSSLQDLSLLVVVQNIMKQDNVQKIFSQNFADEQLPSTLSSMSVSKIMQICKSHVPEVLERKLVCIVHWVKDQLFDWIRFIYKELSWQSTCFVEKKCFKQIINAVVWDFNGTVNYRSSLHRYFSYYYYESDDRVLAFLFKIASRFCLKDDVKILWAKMSKNEKEGFLQTGLCTHSDDRNYTYPILYPYGYGRISDCECTHFYFTFYWACFMCRNMRSFEHDFYNYASYYSRYSKLLGIDVDHDEGYANYYIFIYSVLDPKGSYAAVEYFFERSFCDVEGIVMAYFKNFARECRHNYEDAKILLFLLSEVEDDEFVKKIFNQFSSIFLELSVKYWPWHRFLAEFMKMFSNEMAEPELYCIITKVIEGIKSDTMDRYMLKDIWSNISIEAKKSFCNYICNEGKSFWVEYMTIDMIKMFMKDEKAKEILTPYKNDGVLELISVHKYEVIDHWLDKFLGNEEAIAVFMEDFIVKHTVDVININFKEWALSGFNGFLKCFFKYEDNMNKNEILKVKDKVVEDVGVEVMVRGIEEKEWDEVNTFVDWALKNRDGDYDDKLVNLKMRAVKKIFESSKLTFLEENNFEKSFNKFLEYGVSDIEKLNVVMSEINLHESDNCSKWLKNGNWELIDAFLKFSAKYAKDILKMKENILLHIFSNGLVSCFKSGEFCQNIKKLLYWNSNLDPDIRKKILEIKKLVIEKYGLESIIKCMHERSRDVFNNLMDFLFKDNKLENFEKIIFDLKIRSIDELMKDEELGKEKKLWSMINLVNYRKNDKNLVKEIWDVKKYFIEQLKKNVKVEMFPYLITVKNNIFILSIFEDHTHETDFKNVLWDLKEFLLKEIVNNEDSMLISQLFENFNRFEAFLSWNGFNETELENFKKMISDDIKHILFWNWIFTDKLPVLEKFFSWTLPKDSQWDEQFLELQKLTLMKFCENSEHWTYDNCYFLNKFLMIKYSKNLKNLKKDIIEKYAVKSCCSALSKGDFDLVTNFRRWAFYDPENYVSDVEEDEDKDDSEDENVPHKDNDNDNNCDTDKHEYECEMYCRRRAEIENSFKKKVMEQVLNVEFLDDYWKKQNVFLDKNKYEFPVGLNQFLYDVDYPTLPVTCNMKLEIMESYMIPIFKKFVFKKQIDHLKNFFEWAFDSYMESDEFLPRINKLKKEIFDKFGKDYCALMLRGNDLEAAREFIAPFFCNDQPKVKSVLWEFKKDVIDKLLTNVLQEENMDCSDNGEFWNCLNKFLLWGPSSINITNEIFKLKENARERYGLDIIVKFFNEIEYRRYLELRYFLKWLFGTNNSKIEMDLDEKVLSNFIKDIVGNVFTIKYQAIMKKVSYYDFLDEIFNFNPRKSLLISNMKKSMAKTLGVKLCINLIRENNKDAIKNILHWIDNIRGYDVFGFRVSVITEVAGNSNLEYSFESLILFLKDTSFYNYGRYKETDELNCYVFYSFGLDICYNWIVKNQVEDIRAFLKWGLGPVTSKKLMDFKNRLIHKYKLDVSQVTIFENSMLALELD